MSSHEKDLKHLRKAKAYLESIDFNWTHLLNGPIRRLENAVRGDDRVWATLKEIPEDVRTASSGEFTCNRDADGHWIANGQMLHSPFYGPWVAGGVR
jgi:hypothetical protein